MSHKRNRIPLHEDQWIPYIVANNGYTINEALWNEWKRNNTKSSPIKQNSVHIKTLNEVYKADYKNVVIFSKAMFVQNTEGIKTIDEIYSIQEFIG